MRGLSSRFRLAGLALVATIATAAIAGAFVSTGAASRANVSLSHKVTPPFVGAGLEASSTLTFTVNEPSTLTHVVASFLFSKDVTVASAGQRSPGTGRCSPSTGVAKQVDCAVERPLKPGESVTYDVFFTGTAAVEVTARVAYREASNGSTKPQVFDRIESLPGSVTFLASTTNRNGVCARTFPATLATDAVSAGNPQSTSVVLGQAAAGEACAPITAEELSSNGFTCGSSPCHTQISSVLFPGVGTVRIVIDESTHATHPPALYYFSDPSDTVGEPVPGCSGTGVPATGCIQSVTTSGSRITYELRVDGGPGIDPLYGG